VSATSRAARLRFDRSAAALAAGSRFLQGGVSSDFRLGVLPHPLVFERAEGALLFDVDGNRLIDYYLGMGPLILGHRPAEVAAAVAEQLERGWLFAGQHAAEYRAAELVCRLVPSAERVRFGSSGSEAIQAALRLARAVTGRSTVLKFEGHYHGWFDSTLWSVAPALERAGPADAPTPVPGSAGQDPDVGRSVGVLGWNDADAVEVRLSRGDVAAVIMEPAMCNQGAIPPHPGYLERVRAACDAQGTLLIFDEVITGFRLGPGGAQGRFGVTPDLTILAKALASGFPVSALVGRERLMAELGPGRAMHAGTYNSHALGMAATVATLERLADPATYQELKRRGARLMAGIGTILSRAAVPHRVQGWPSVFNVAVGTDEPIVDYRSSLRADRPLYRRLALALLERGVRILERGTWFLSTAHDDALVDETLEAFGDAVGEVWP
jgi:glutamate-1-semialdehyde 2,1-aminomutase